MTTDNICPPLQVSLLVDHNPLIDLYLLKKSMEFRLVHEIRLNLELQERIHLANSQVDFCQAQLKIQESCQDFSSVERSNKRVTSTRKQKNETKNVPKNFGKAIISFVEQNEELVSKLLQEEGVSYYQFVGLLREKKKIVNSIAELRGLWLESGFRYAKTMRMISTYFLKKVSLEYIFGSKICNHAGHIKYRKRLLHAIQNPAEFTFIKI